MTDIELGWVAGIFEGEGTIVFIGKNSVQTKIRMTDKDVLERFHEIVGIGSLKYEAYRLKARPHVKPSWIWSAGRKDEIEPFLDLLIPILGERRRTRAIEALERLTKSHSRSRPLETT